MKNIKLTIEYDGTHYHGWQSQINALTVQEVVSQAIGILTDQGCNLIGASRTDTGVHALGQVANFMTDSSIPPDKFCYAINNLLARDIVIKKSEEVPLEFHSRFSAKGKRYKYLILNSSQPSVFYRDRAMYIKRELHLESMQEAAQHFLGTHDFSAFKSTGDSIKSNIRTITGVSLDRNEDVIEFQITGNGFLYNMVRIIVGTLVEVGQGKIRPKEIPDIIRAGQRIRAGKTAVPQGLYLVEVYY